MDYAIVAVVALAVGVAIGYFLFLKVIKGKYNEMVSAAEKEAEVIKEKKLLEVKEKFITKKGELEKEVQQRNQHLQQSENRLKQREISLNQRRTGPPEERTGPAAEQNRKREEGHRPEAGGAGEDAAEGAREA